MWRYQIQTRDGEPLGIPFRDLRRALARQAFENLSVGDPMRYWIRPVRSCE